MRTTPAVRQKRMNKVVRQRPGRGGPVILKTGERIVRDWLGEVARRIQSGPPLSLMEYFQAFEAVAVIAAADRGGKDWFATAGHVGGRPEVKRSAAGFYAEAEARSRVNGGRKKPAAENRGMEGASAACYTGLPRKTGY
jgi:hypothetical protein